jgi:hypothetical protein
MATTNDKMEFAYIMAKHSELTLHTLKRIMRYASTHQRLMTEECNRGLSNLEQLKVRNVRAMILHLVGATVDACFSGDPRGATVKLRVQDGYTTDWGREGICVPTS